MFSQITVFVEATWIYFVCMDCGI